MNAACRAGLRLGLSFFGPLSLILAVALPARGNDSGPADVTAGVEVQARGPLHEAFAEPVSGKPQPGPVVAKKPPAPIEELPPDRKPAGDNVQWIGGYWAWDDDRNDFLWVSGLYRQPPAGR